MLPPPDDPLVEAQLVPPPPRLGPPSVIRPVRIDPHGLAGPTRHQARSKRWRRLGRGWVVPAGAVDHIAQSVVEAGAMLLPGEAVTGWPSLHLAGTEYVDGTTTARVPLPIRLLVRSPRPIRSGVHASRSALRCDEIVIRSGVPCTNVHRALLDELCGLATVPGLADDDTLREAVVVIDMVLHAELTSRQRFGDYLSRVPRRRGLRLARAALALAVEGAESPRETLMNLVWRLDAGLPAPLCNHPIHTTGGAFLARPDLLSLEYGVVGEYDGLHHQETRRRSRDISREGALRNHGLEVFSFVAGELHDRERAARRMLEAVARARNARRPQTWTLAPSSWSLDERMSLRERQVRLTRGPEAHRELLRDTPPKP